jgi:hypothetical protein
MVTLSICHGSALGVGVPWFEDVTFKDIVNVDIKFKP